MVGKQLDLIGVTDAELTRRTYRGASGFHYVTSSSALVEDEYGRPRYIGKCHRQQWYKHKGYPREPFSALAMRRMQYGVDIENALQERWKRAGIFVDNNVKFRVLGLKLSGEIDAIVFDDEAGHPVPVEVKSSHGYTLNKKVFGRGDKMYKSGMPKAEHLMQVGCYLYFRKEIEEVYGEMPYALLYYIDRGGCEDTQFQIYLSDDYEGEIRVRDKNGNEVIPSQYYAQDDRNCQVDFKPQRMVITMDEVIRRLQELPEKLESDEPPEREYFMRYPDALAKDMFMTGELSKSMYDKFEKNTGDAIGDWQCSFCDYATECYPQGADTDISEDTHLQRRALPLYDSQY